MEPDVRIKFSNTPQKVKTTRSENYREITQDRIYAGFREGYFIYMIQNEPLDTNKQEEREEEYYVDEVQVKVSPQQIVKTYKLFGKLIEQYEKLYGEIKTLEQIVSENPDLMEDS